MNSFKRQPKNKSLSSTIGIGTKVQAKTELVYGSKEIGEVRLIQLGKNCKESFSNKTYSARLTNGKDLKPGETGIVAGIHESEDILLIDSSISE